MNCDHITAIQAPQASLLSSCTRQQQYQQQVLLLVRHP